MTTKDTATAEKNLQSDCCNAEVFRRNAFGTDRFYWMICKECEESCDAVPKNLT